VGTKTYTGVNIQWPISELILSGEKTIETRTYPLPEKYLNQPLLLIETSGKSANFKARVVAIIKFTKSFKYESKKKFYEDINLHKVDPKSMWAWQDEKPKWGWQVEVIKKIKPILAPKKKGIVFTNSIKINSK
jgi:hypothetical protein